MGKTIDLAGQRFGRLTVIGEAGQDAHRMTLWLCGCDCGRRKIVRSYDLRKGNILSCGCRHSERVALSNKRRAKDRAVPSGPVDKDIFDDFWMFGDRSEDQRRWFSLVVV